MKKAALYLFLLTYATVMLKPAMPYVADGVAHVLFYKDHMLTMHAHNGKFHVHAQITEGAKTDNTEKSTDTKKDNGNDHIVFEISSFKIVLSPPIHLLLNAPLLIDAAISHDFPPPRV